MFDLGKIFDLSKKFARPHTLFKLKNYCTISIYNINFSEKITYIWRNWNSMMRLLRRWRLLLLMLTKHRIWSENDVLQGAVRI